jgi:hypothetical protein
MTLHVCPCPFLGIFPVGVQDDPAALKEAEITSSVTKLHTLSGNQPLYSHDRYCNLRLSNHSFKSKTQDLLPAFASFTSCNHLIFWRVWQDKGSVHQRRDLQLQEPDGYAQGQDCFSHSIRLRGRYYLLPRSTEKLSSRFTACCSKILLLVKDPVTVKSTGNLWCTNTNALC